MEAPVGRPAEPAGAGGGRADRRRADLPRGRAGGCSSRPRRWSTTSRGSASGWGPATGRTCWPGCVPSWPRAPEADRVRRVHLSSGRAPHPATGRQGRSRAGAQRLSGREWRRRGRRRGRPRGQLCSVVTRASDPQRVSSQAPSTSAGGGAPRPRARGRRSGPWARLRAATKTVVDSVCRSWVHRSADRPAAGYGLAAALLPRRGRAEFRDQHAASTARGRMQSWGASMELTKHGHACVVLCDGDRRLVIDPGVFTEPAALDGRLRRPHHPRAPDHFVADRLRAALDGRPGAGGLDQQRRSPPSWTGSGAGCTSWATATP